MGKRNYVGRVFSAGKGLVDYSRNSIFSVTMLFAKRVQWFFCYFLEEQEFVTN